MRRREQAESLTARIETEIQRNDGEVPLGLLREIQAAHIRRTGSIVTADDVRQYVNRLLERKDRRPRPVRHGDDSVDRAVDVLATCTPTAKPREWAEAVETVEAASRAGVLSPAQVAELDALDAVYDAKARIGD